MSEHVLIVTVGLPRSGKTTWALERSKQRSAPIVNPDSIRLAMHGQRYIVEAEPYVWAVAKTMVNALFLAGHYTVILDATNNTIKRREMWISSKWITRFKLITTNQSVCLERAKDDDEIIPVINRMADAFERLTPDEQKMELTE